MLLTTILKMRMMLRMRNVLMMMMLLIMMITGERLRNLFRLQQAKQARRLRCVQQRGDKVAAAIL